MSERSGASDEFERSFQQEELFVPTIDMCNGELHLQRILETLLQEPTQFVAEPVPFRNYAMIGLQAGQAIDRDVVAACGISTPEARYNGRLRAYTLKLGFEFGMRVSAAALSFRREEDIDDEVPGMYKEWLNGTSLDERLKEQQDYLERADGGLLAYNLLCDGPIMERLMAQPQSVKRAKDGEVFSLDGQDPQMRRWTLEGVAAGIFMVRGLRDANLVSCWQRQLDAVTPETFQVKHDGEGQA